MADVEDALVLREAARLLIEHRDLEARKALARLSLEDPVQRPIFESSPMTATPGYTPRPPTAAARLAPIFVRDGWRCQYCGRRLVASPIIELLGTLCPVEFPFPRGHHMPRKLTHPAAVRVYPEVDHVHAGSIGGDWREQSNLLTACEPCNTAKSNRQGWTAGIFERDDWDGLVQFYRGLVERSGDLRPYHRGWMKALELLN